MWEALHCASCPQIVVSSWPKAIERMISGTIPCNPKSIRRWLSMHNRSKICPYGSTCLHATQLRVPAVDLVFADVAGVPAEKVNGIFELEPVLAGVVEPSPDFALTKISTV